MTSELALARRQASAGRPIESVVIKGVSVTVRYASLVPEAHADPVAFKRLSHGNRVQDTVTLHEETNSAQLERRR